MTFAISDTRYQVLIPIFTIRSLCYTWPWKIWKLSKLSSLCFWGGKSIMFETGDWSRCGQSVNQVRTHFLQLLASVVSHALHVIGKTITSSWTFFKCKHWKRLLPPPIKTNGPICTIKQTTWLLPHWPRELWIIYLLQPFDSLWRKDNCMKHVERDWQNRTEWH